MQALSQSGRIRQENVWLKAGIVIEVAAKQDPGTLLRNTLRGEPFDV